MAAPTLTGTAAGTAQTTAIFIDVTMTVPADAELILVGFGGFSNGAAITVSSVQGDPTGTPYNIDDITQYAQRGTDQYAGIYGIDDQNVNWPGSGSVTIRVSLTGADSDRQLKAGICCVKDVDTTGTYVNGTQTGTNAASTPSMVVTSTTNALDFGCVGSYSADIGGGDDTVIYEEQNSTTSSSLYFWHEAGASSSNTVEGNASVAWAGVAVSIEGTSSGTTVNATTDALVITEYAANINAATGVDATTDALVITEYAATVALGGDTNVNATSVALAITEYTATIDSPLFAIADTFDGTGTLGSHWLNYQSSVQTVDRQSGYMEADVDDNTADVTLWYNTDRGRMDYQRVRFPTGAVPNEYIFYNIGVGPVGTPRDDLSYSANQFSFAGLIVHDATTSTNAYMFSVVGHRGTLAQSTIEIKSTVATGGGTSYVDDEGTDVFGTGVTHGDLAVELRNDGSAKFKYKDVSSSTWTYINSGTGLTPGAPTVPPDLGTGGDEVLVGFISYASGTTGIPWVGSADSFDVFEGTFRTVGLSITTYAASVSAAKNVPATSVPLVITEYSASISTSSTNVEATTGTLVITTYQSTLTFDVDVQASTASLNLAEYNATVAAQVPDFTIDNQATQTISTAYGSLKVYGNGENWFTLG